MSELDHFFKNHKASFDRLEPKENAWRSIKEEYDKRKQESDHKEKKKRLLFLYKMAATVLLIVGLSTLYFSSNIESKSVFDNIAMISPQGTSIPLDPSLNKLTLVQFWESGNILCNTENCYYYLPAYEKYKDQGFEIYAISLDDDKESWVLGIEENDLPWIHVSDLKGWDSPICIECNISKTPTSFLLDQNGKVIARDLNAEDLDDTLNHLLAQN